jgi:hypothetical protein
MTKKELLELPRHAWLTPRQAAVVLDLSANALAARRCRGEWPLGVKLGLKTIRYRLSELVDGPTMEAP